MPHSNVSGESLFCQHIWVPCTVNVEFKKENSAYQYQGSHKIKNAQYFQTERLQIKV